MQTHTPMVSNWSQGALNHDSGLLEARSVTTTVKIWSHKSKMWAALLEDTVPLSSGGGGKRQF